MKKSVKISIIVLCGVFAFIALFMFICAINQIVKTQDEDALINDAIEKGTYGSQYKVNGHLINVYIKGSGKTIVFLSGEGSASPVLEFRSLYNLLSDYYRIVVIERAGYGFSAETDGVSRDLDTVLSESRKALMMANVTLKNLVLCAHSNAGLEAIYWSQKHPDEVRQIVGLDIVTPQMWEKLDGNEGSVKGGALAIDLGLTRLTNNANDDVVQYGTLTDGEKELYRALYYKKSFSDDMKREASNLRKNAALVAAKDVPDIPYLLFVSNSVGTGFSYDDWRAYQEEFVSTSNKCDIIYLDCAHAVHNFKYQVIADYIIKKV